MNSVIRILNEWWIFSSAKLPIQVKGPVAW